MKTRLLVTLTMVFLLIKTSSANAITPEQQIGLEFCQIQTLKEANLYIEKLARIATQKYNKEVQRAIKEKVQGDYHYYYKIAHIGITKHCNTAKSKQLINSMLKMLQWQKPATSKEFTLNYQKQVILTNQLSEFD
ncbi:MAG: hypothetical protein HC932_04165 [Thermales bacterium]|nr:hypothetical protein [Thermales bacterium]